MPETSVSVILEALRERNAWLIPFPGVTGTLGVVVTGGTDGDVKVRVRLEDGRPVAAGLDGTSDPELTLTLPVAEARAIASGDLDPSVAFMQGRLKTAGDNGLLLGVLAATASPGWSEWVAGLVSGEHAEPAPPDAGARNGG